MSEQRKQLPFSKMGCIGCYSCCCRLRGFAVLVLLFFVTGSSQLTEGRAAIQFSGPSKGAAGRETAIAMIERIGSTPPRCDRKCSSCGHCEAIQVPMNPQGSRPSGDGENYASQFAVGEYYSRDRGDDDSSNYKPMSWKCKCGKFIFNP
ncbi:EPIDERMAL PATTERNING FACTOR-like protein 2 [Punica granatum]|uniref:Epidermal patterning factor-like protein n=1 Tax=Punica granatum TaxID=22663 RepID=A0A218XAV2_PUNGR|nr:EPIDERMAL PATTERNING FACTOR-like protein 2 [Punica granatum]OWM82064.1 hypothetical protein CDL15_Pgr001638 [Punica granatum]